MIQTRVRRNTQSLGRSAEWDELVGTVPGVSPLQAAAWGRAKERQGWHVMRLAAVSGDGMAAAQVLWRTTLLGTILYIPRGPVVVNDSGGELTRDLFDTIHEEARVLGAAFLKVEPNTTDPGILPRLGFRRSDQTTQAGATIIVDLTQDEATLQSRLQRTTRYNIGLAHRKGVEVQVTGPEGIDAFYAMLKETGSRDAFHIRSVAYYRDVVEEFGDQAEVLLATHDGDTLAAAILVRIGDEAGYLYGSSGNTKRNLKGTQYLQWRCILRMKAAGCARYDMWGVPADASAADDGEDLPEGAEHRPGDLWGVYQFKRGFGGQIITFAGAWDYVYKPARYWAWVGVTPRIKSLLRRSVGAAA